MVLRTIPFARLHQTSTALSIGGGGYRCDRENLAFAANGMDDGAAPR